MQPLRDALARTGVDEARMDDAEVLELLLRVAAQARTIVEGSAERSAARRP